MSMKKNLVFWDFEKLAYPAIFIIGLTLRLLHLGQFSLSDEEARLALQALSLARGEIPSYQNPDGGYLVFTGVLFFIFNATNFLARFVPALLGALICLMPVGFRTVLGKKAALILSLGLALDGAWLSSSRQAGGHSWAVFFFLISLWALHSGRWKLGGVFIGLALLGGTEIWKGLLPFLTALGIFWWTNRAVLQPDESEMRIKHHVGKIALWGGGALLVIGTFFLLLPAGLSAFGGGLIEYLRGWGSSAGASIGLVLGTIVVYQPVALLFGIAGAFYQVKQVQPVDRFLTVWWIISLFHLFFYPAREVLDLIWVSLPLLAMASRMLVIFFDTRFEQKNLAIIYAAIVFVFLMFVAQNIARLLSPERVAVNTQPEVIGILAGLVFVAGSIALVAWGWSGRVAGFGAIGGLLSILLLFWLSGSIHASGLGEHPETNPFLQGSLIREADLLNDTIGDISELNFLSRSGADIVAAGLNQPALRWAAREYPYFTFENTLQPQLQSSMVLTPSALMVEYGEPYRGQDFEWGAKPIWDLMTLQEWLQWAIFKTAPLESNMIILWARESLFPGNQISTEVQP